MFLLRKHVISVGLVAVAALLAGCGDASSDAAPVAAPAALAVPAQALVYDSAYEQLREFTGRVEAARQSDVGFELGGQLVEVLVDEGGLVARGEAIARLDTARLDAREAEARAALNQARAEAALAKATRARIAEAL